MQSACAVIYCHLWPVWLYHIFPHFLTNGTIFGKKKRVIEHKMRVMIFSTITSEIFFTVRRIEEDSVISAHRPSCEVPVILIRIQWKIQFSRNNFEKKIPKYKILRKFVQWKPSCSTREAKSSSANAPDTEADATMHMSSIISSRAKGTPQFLQTITSFRHSCNQTPFC